MNVGLRLTESLGAFVLGCLLAFALTPVVRHLGQRVLDIPGGRKQHPAAVPRIGGIAVVLSVVLAISAFSSFDATLLATPGMIVALAAVFAIGLADDLKGVRPISKILVQASAATLMYEAGFRVDSLSNPVGGGVIQLGVFALPITILWFVGMSNALNLIDGLDGLASGIGLFATLTFFLAAVMNGRWEIVIPTAALAGALLGFLRYNFNPASIFLGDCGSLSIGFLLAAFAVGSSMKSSAALAVTAPLLTLALPLVDTVLAIVRRFLRGQPISVGDAEHIHHRLLRLGMTPRRVAVVMYGLAGMLGAVSLLTMSQTQVTGVVLLVVSCVAWIGIQQLGYAEFGEMNRILRRGLFFQRRIVMNNLQLLDLRTALRQSRSVEDVWRHLTQLSDRLGFSSAEMTLEPAYLSRLAEANGGHVMPRLYWEDRVDHADPKQWTWMVPVYRGAELLATLVLRRPLRESSVYFELGYLLEAVRDDVSAALVACCTAPAEKADDSVPLDDATAAAS